MDQASPNHWRIHERRHPQLLEHLCLLRGLDATGLAPDYALHLHDPFLLPDMEKACALIGQAHTEQWPITIFGDYDADGTPAAALLSLVLGELGLKHEVVLPTRLSGYGLRIEQVRQMAQHSRLLITVDTGISSVEEITEAKALGLNVIILDHHLPPLILPPADAIVDPHRADSRYPFAELCGCALAYKFAVALGQTFPQISERFTKWLLDLVAISTVADMMPLSGENRALVHYGLVVLRQNRRPGLKALLKLAGVESSSLTAGSLGFIVGPRLNAAGRLGDNSPAYELLKAGSDEVAHKFAEKIEAANGERQTLVAKVMAEAEQVLFEQNDRADRIYLLAKADWPAGVVGLVAGKIAAQHARPVLVATFENDTARGSARSIEAYPIVTALERQRDFLESYGGHASAAGFSLPAKQWPKFSKQMKSDAREILSEALLRRTYTVDAQLEPDDVSKRSVDSLERLQPFGLGNSRPLFLLRSVTLRDSKRIGREGRHIKGRLVSADYDLAGVGFGLADRFKAAPPLLDCIGHLEVNRWQNQEMLQFQIIDYRPGGDKLEWIPNGQAKN